ncbi:flagellin synthesis regulatory protein [Fictibacillus macauensis ZFHKF-1]|uniref:Negative regulator of flagellin synthesis n=1 Tax=Fictibacillus macauensis ZFHKF-1 TaxID=1196324 RepID=I8UJC2_9BACL|nr:flagellar biosynthesis anti-sigma factor FlgM [Fictibacillus macauensis]EIT86938.1 flagellin synthesis regulatory protein [Fictibacillus macauensis ZFHKF-1]
MKINTVTHVNNNPYREKENTFMPKESRRKQEDQLRISTEAQELLKTHSWSADREERIASLSKAIGEGSYSIEPTEIAKKMTAFWETRT